MSAPVVSIVIPTLRRPGPLAAAAASALAQASDMDQDLRAELLVVDNDPGRSAEAQVQALAEGAPMPVRYVHAAEPGVANARNAGVAAARGAFIAFLDDDEIAPPGWLRALIDTQRRFAADAVFGPVRARLPDGPLEHRDYLAGFFSRTGPARAQLIADGPGCGDSLVRKAALPHPTEPFSSTRNAIGGEDDLLFAAMKTGGARFAWAPEAWVWEVPEPSRLTLTYTLRRAFTFGQGPCSQAAARGGVHWAMVPPWMLVGLAQVLIHGVRGLAGLAVRSPRRAVALDRAAQGLGKILWFPPFKIGFYGRVALAASELQASTGSLDRKPREERRMGVISRWTPAQAKRFGQANLSFRHALHERPQFSDEGLAAILDRYPRSRLGVFTMGDDPVAWRTWRRGVAEGLSGAELLEAVRQGRIWLNLRAVNDHDDGYRALSDEIFADVEQATGQRTFRRDVGLLISSPAVQVFYHLDVPLVMLWQLRGTKTVWLYSPRTPYVDDAQLERIVLKETAEQFDYNPAWDAGAERVVLEPGAMVTWPQNAPHRIENGPMINVSLSIEFMTPAALLRANVLYANGMLRKTFGARPAVQAAPDPRAFAKLGAARAWKALRPGERSRDPLPATFSLVRGQPGAIAAL